MHPYRITDFRILFWLEVISSSHRNQKNYDARYVQMFSTTGCIKKRLQLENVSGKELHSTELATKINESFLCITNSLPPLNSQLENVESDPAIINEIISKYHISPEEVFTKLSNLKRTKASGSDNLPNWVLNEFAGSFHHPLLKSLMRQFKRDSYPSHGKKQM